MHGATLEVLDRSSPGLAWTLAAHGLVWQTKRTFYNGVQVFARSYEPPEPGVLPHFTSLPQIETERHLLQACKDAGVAFAWGTAVTDAATTAEGITLITDAGDTWRASYVIAADGSRSTVRRSLGFVMEGERSDGWYIVVDVNDVYFSRQTGFPLDRMNPYGCSLIYGHPQGPTGLRAIAELIQALRDRGGGRGLFTGCAAGDTAGAVVVEVDA